MTLTYKQCLMEGDMGLESDNGGPGTWAEGEVITDVSMVSGMMDMDMGTS